MSNLRVWVVTIYPEYFDAFKNCGVVGQCLNGQRGRKVDLEIVNLRDYALDKHHSVDDYPYGGGPGMIMKADVLKNCLEAISNKIDESNTIKENMHVVYTSPRGRVWDHGYCVEFAKQHFSNEVEKDLVFICGRFEGVDERFIEKYVDETISLGDFVLTGGEPAVMCILDSSLRFVEGVLGNKLSAQEESFSKGMLEAPQYTRPRVFEDSEVPEVLLNGHHAKIEIYQQSESRRLTKNLRPDLWEKLQ